MKPQDDNGEEEELLFSNDFEVKEIVFFSLALKE